MNREIKFRAWDKRNNCFYTKTPIAVNADGVIRLDVDNGTWRDTSLIPMLFTGLKDKNGKEIYEGDILRDDCNELHEVKFGKLPLDKSGDCVCTYEAFYCKCYGKLGQSPFYECAQIGDWMEVVGNIYKNPELLS